MNKNRRHGGSVPVLSAMDAVAMIEDGSVVAVVGAGGGITEPTKLIDGLAERFKKTGEPKNLTFWHATGLGDRGDRGMSPFAQQGLVKRVIGGHWGQSPRLAEMAERGEIEAYCLPQGTMSQLLRTAAAGQPGLLTHSGLNTYIDPRQTGGKLNDRTTEELIELVEMDGREWLYYRAPKIDVAIIRGTTADTDGYISMESEIALLDSLPMAQAAHNNGGIVIVQVKNLVKAGTIHSRNVKIPGYLVDAVVVDPDQNQLYNVQENRFFSGDYIEEEGKCESLPLNERKVVARRALMEIKDGDVGNLGVGISDGIGNVAREEGLSGNFTLTIETGPIGGVTAQGIFFGASVNSKALSDMPAQFDFYGGGGLDICFLSFAEVDPLGNVNVSRFNGKIQGVGGFIDISSRSRKIIFSGTLTAGGLKTEVGDGRITITNEGRFKKFLTKTEEVSFSAAEAVRNGQEVLYLTERAVFRLTCSGIMLTEVAPGIDIERDIVAHMGFRPLIADEVTVMDSRIFTDGMMAIKEEWLKS